MGDKDIELNLGTLNEALRSELLYRRHMRAWQFERELKKRMDDLRVRLDELVDGNGLDPKVVEKTTEVEALWKAAEKEHEAYAAAHAESIQKAKDHEARRKKMNNDLFDEISLLRSEEYRRGRIKALAGAGIDLGITERQLVSGNLTNTQVLALLDMDKFSTIVDGAETDDTAKAIAIAQKELVAAGQTGPLPENLNGLEGVIALDAATTEAEWASKPMLQRQLDLIAVASARMPWTTSQDIGALATDMEVTTGITFVEVESGRAVDKDGHRYTYEDYLTGSTPLRPGGDSFKVLLDRHRERAGFEYEGQAFRPRGSDGFAPLNPRFVAPQSLSAGEMKLVFLRMGEANPRRLANYQKLLKDAGFIREDEEFAPGHFDTTTSRAFEEALGRGHWEALATGKTFSEWLNQEAKAVSAVRNASGGGGRRAFSTTDPVALNMTIDAAGQQILGRNLTPEERAGIAERIHSMEVSEGGKTSGEVVSIDAGAQAADLVRQAHPDDAKAHDLAASFDMFAGIIGAGMGLGDRQESFGGSTIGLNTL